MALAAEDVAGPRLAPSAPALAETVAARDEATKRRSDAARLRARAEGELAAAPLLEDAWRFLAAGGAVTRAEWRALEPRERWALARAGEALERERAELLAAALRRPAPADPVEAAGRAAIAESAGRTT